jgi:hypothetical protein
MNSTVLSRWGLLTLGAVSLGLQAQGALPETKLAPADSTLFELFGWAVAVDGDVAVAGAPSDAPQGLYNAGSGYVFVRGDSGWVPQAKLAASDPTEFSQFGHSVAVSGDTVAVGARYDTGNAGAVYVFTRDGTHWTQPVKLVPADRAAAREFGCAVALDGNTLVAGAPADAEAGFNAGAAYVFVRNGTGWSQQAKLLPGPLAPGDTFGFAVALSGETVAVGAPYNDQGGLDAGAVQVFVRAGEAWTHQADLVAPAAGDNALLGWSVAADGDTILAGAPQDSGRGEWAGAAYLFTRASGIWSSPERLSAETPGEYEFCGYSVGLRGEYAAVGAPNAANPPFYQNGAVHLFQRSTRGWSWTRMVRPADNTEGDQFGYSMALSGTNLIVGAPYQDLGWGFDDGAVYAFELPTPPKPNQPPVADASATVTEVPSANRRDAAVTLDGSKSSDQDGDPLTFQWSQEGTSLGAGEKVTVNLPVGTHLITLTVSDTAASATTTVTVRVLPVNRPPVADASATLTEISAGIAARVAVVLDGSRSSDPDGDPLTMQWFEGENLLASGSPASVALPSGPHEITLVVSDGLATATDAVTVNVARINHPPVAEAGPSGLQVISPNNRNAAVTLDGRQSFDPDGDDLSYEWLRGDTRLAETPLVMLTLPVGLHRFVLRVGDGQDFATDRITVRVITASSAVRSLMESLREADLPASREKALLALLRGAIVSFDRGHMRTGAGQLLVFERLVLHREGRPLDPRTARALVREAQKIVDAVAGR